VEGGTDYQPAQSSGRSGPGPEPGARKTFDEGEAPSEQGHGSPSPESLKAESHGQHGQKRQSGSRAAGQGRGEDEATVHEK
jgi:hypothetical protein